MFSRRHSAIALAVHSEVVFLGLIPELLSSHRTIISCESKGKYLFLFLFFSNSMFCWIFLLSVYSLCRKAVSLSIADHVPFANISICCSCLLSLRFASSCSYGIVRIAASLIFSLSISASLSEQKYCILLYSASVWYSVRLSLHCCFCHFSSKSVDATSFTSSSCCSME